MRFFFIVLGCLSLLARPAFAEIIQDIVVQGNQRIERETVLSYMSLRKGDEFDAQKIDRSLKSLFATGLFDDIEIESRGSSLVVKVIESPIVNQLVFEGNNRLEDEQLYEEVSLKPRMVYSKAKAQRDLQRILELYRRSGRYSVIVTPELIKRPRNRVDVIFKINEGQPTYVSSINFIGNNSFSSSDLKEELMTKESRWYRLFSSTDTYDPDRANYDKELLRRFYLKKGYYDFNVLSLVAELSPDRESFFMTFKISEGPRYRIGKTSVETRVPYLKKVDLKPYVMTESGAWFNLDNVENTQKELNEYLGSLGHAFVNVEPRVTKDEKNRTLDIVYLVSEGPKAFINRINVTGNVRTEDKVIRREFTLAEGDAFNLFKMRRSKQRVENLGYFSKADVQPVPVPMEEDKIDINVEVEERSTGSVSFGVGWSTYNGPLADISINESNLLGKGYNIGARLSVSAEDWNLDFSLSDPYFLDKRLLAGVDVFYKGQSYEDESSYDMETYGGVLRLGWEYTEHLRQTVKYTLKDDLITNVSPVASIYIRSREGNNLVSMVSQILSYDRRDNAFRPTEGYYLSLSNDVAGLGGSESFLRSDAMAEFFYPVYNDWVLAFSLGGGYVYSLDGEDISLAYRYYLGGDNLRGFERAGASPRDKFTGDALGGNWIATAKAQLNFPLGLPTELGMTGKVFFDAGTTGKPEDASPAYLDYSSSIRASVGVGIMWMSPLGPINIDFGFPVQKEDFDKTEVFRLGFSTRF